MKSHKKQNNVRKYPKILENGRERSIITQNSEYITFGWMNLPLYRTSSRAPE
jgi:hypothetical protein